MTGNQKADIGVFGGSGFYSFLEETEEYEIDTPYGNPSDKIVIGRVEGKRLHLYPGTGEIIIYLRIKLIIERIFMQ